MAKKGYRDDSRNSFVGNGTLDSVIIASLSTTDKGMIYLASDLGQTAGEDARKRIDKQTVTFASDGGTDAGLLTLKRYCVDEVGDALASGVTVTIDGTDYTTGAGGVISHALDLEDLTVKDLLDQINALPGFVAEIGDALTTTTLDGDDIIVDMAETNIPQVSGVGEKLEILKNDVSATNVAYLRIGLPTRKDRDPLQLLQIRGSITDNTDATLQLLRDDEGEYVSDGSHQEEYEAFAPATSLTEHLDENVLEGQTIRGPVVLKVAATAITGASYKVKYRQALV